MWGDYMVRTRKDKRQRVQNLWLLWRHFYLLHHQKVHKTVQLPPKPEQGKRRGERTSDGSVLTSASGRSGRGDRKKSRVCLARQPGQLHPTLTSNKYFSVPVLQFWWSLTSRLLSARTTSSSNLPPELHTLTAQRPPYSARMLFTKPNLQDASSLPLSH